MDQGVLQVKVIHKLEVTALCPVDQKPDVYQCKVTARRVIQVESIIAAAAAESKDPIYQEDLCMALHRSLACRVSLVGYHSGVRTKVVCG